MQFIFGFAVGFCVYGVIDIFLARRKRKQKYDDKQIKSTEKHTIDKEWK